MITLPDEVEESYRVEMVRSFGLVDGPRAALHDEVAALARDLSGAATALISLVASKRNWFAGIANYPEPDQCRWTSFCTHVVAHPGAPLWIADTNLDFRFATNPYVVGEPHVRFYAGAPIVVNGYAVGSVCVLDGDPRPLDPVLAAQLVRLANIVGDDLATRHRVQSLQRSLVASADALIDCDDQGVITHWSEGAERLLGFEAAEAIGRNINIIVPPDQVAAHNRGLEHWRLSGAARLERRIELVAQRKDGSQLDIELWMSVAHLNGVRHIHANIRDISERKRQAAELLAAKIEAEAATLAKSTFLSNMSHELRTPLNGVIAVTELLAQSELSPAQRELTSIIQSSSDQLRRLVGDILDLARVESGEFTLSEVPILLAETVEDVRNLLTLQAQEKGLSLVSDIRIDAGVRALGDPLRLKQVLTNLISNAVKFTEQGSVTICVASTPSGFRFEISDTGIGFNAEQQAVIFERFRQADGSITRKFGGTGLGLAISRELVAAMGGELECRGRSGQGSTFWFTLPLQVIAEMSETALPDQPDVDITRVLVVDDNPTNRRVAELLLQSIGSEVVCAEDGHQAVEMFLNEPFDAVLMDMMMPVMDGIAATQAIRRLELARNLDRTPVVMLTANNLPEHVAASLDAGADAHLAKPITPAALFETLVNVLIDNAGSNEEARRARVAPAF